MRAAREAGPNGPGTYTAPETGRIPAPDYSNELSVAQDYFSREDSVLRNAYDHRRRLLELDRKYELKTEGDYQRELLQQTENYEVQREKLRVEAEQRVKQALDARVGAAQKALGSDPKRLSDELADIQRERDKFGERLSTERLKEAADAEFRRADALKDVEGASKKAATAAEDYLKKMERELAADSAAADSKRALAGASAAQIAQAQAVLDFDKKHAAEMERLRTEYEKTTKAAADYGKALGMGPVTPEQAAQQGALGAADLGAGQDLRRAQDAMRKGRETAAETARKSLLPGTAMDGVHSALNDYMTRVADVAASTKNLWTDSFKGLEDSLTNFVMTGKLNFDSLVSTIVGGLVRIGLQKHVLEPMAASVMASTNGGGGGLIASAFSLLGFADGGDPPVGVPYMVGERGPELRIDRTPGTIIPNHALGGQTVQNNVTINNTIGNVASQDDVVMGMRVVEGQILQKLSRSSGYRGPRV